MTDKPRMRRIYGVWYCVGNGIVTQHARAELAYAVWEREARAATAKAWANGIQADWPRVGREKGRESDH